MKLSKITLLVLTASLVTTGCGKRDLGKKAEETTTPEGQPVVAPPASVTTPFKGKLAIGENKKFDELMVAYNSDANKATLKLTAAYALSSKKLTISKEHSSLKIVSVNTEGKSEALDLKKVIKAPALTIGQQALEIQADAEKKQYVLTADAATDVDLTKPITVGLKGEDDNLKIAETTYELSPVVQLGTPEEQSKELVLDLTKGEGLSGIAFFSSYAGAEGDATKPECMLISEKGIGDVKPIIIAGLDLSNQDKVLDLSKAAAELAKIPAGETEIEIDCVRTDASKNPALIAITRTMGLKLKVIQPEVKKEEPKKEEAEK